MKQLLDIVARHKRGQPVGVYSLCSAHPTVIESALREAQANGVPLLVEATSNQVNQFGGYTGMKPADFCRFLHDMCARLSFPRHLLWIGGDHLGPHVWRTEAAAAAMSKAAEMVRQYVAAGFRKIHLDCSMTCAGDPIPLPEETIAARAASLGAVAERTWEEVGGEAPVYVIGTEVPVPGGATEDLQELAVTSPQAAAATIATHREAFTRADLAAAWPRVVALVVQPGVEFDHHRVIDYNPGKARALCAFIETQAQFVFETHSTDYQAPDSLRALVRDHFTILKVGPAATYALRETLWGLAAIAHELAGGREQTDLRSVVIAAMRADPRHWRDHYHDPANESLDLQYSYSDRIRYYWPLPEVQRACADLLDRLRRAPLPLTLLSQYLPRQYAAVRAGRLSPLTDDILHEGIALALRPYARACGVTPGREE
jgi:D-tagatose-1,6-bisphosphate aldolase subunit GatZ/KbaZ